MRDSFYHSLSKNHYSSIGLVSFIYITLGCDKECLSVSSTATFSTQSIFLIQTSICKKLGQDAILAFFDCIQLNTIQKQDSRLHVQTDQHCVYKYTLILNLMPATCFRNIGRRVTKDCKSCGMLIKHLFGKFHK